MRRRSTAAGTPAAHAQGAGSGMPDQAWRLTARTGNQGIETGSGPRYDASPWKTETCLGAQAAQG